MKNRRSSKRDVLLSALIVSMTMSNAAIGHSGGLNSQGCHGGSQPYHCHRSQNEMVGNRLRCDLGSRSAECTRGAALSRSSVITIQRALVRHCSSLGNDFIDGVYGPATVAALARFQSAYGLTPDGIYGPQTEAVLLGAVNGRCL